MIDNREISEVRRAMDPQELEMRTLLALSRSRKHLHTDDGELQDCSVMPHIDYLRMTVNQISEAIMQRNLRTVAEGKEIEAPRKVLILPEHPTPALIKAMVGPLDKECLGAMGHLVHFHTEGYLRLVKELQKK